MNTASHLQGTFSVRETTNRPVCKFAGSGGKETNGTRVDSGRGPGSVPHSHSSAEHMLANQQCMTTLWHFQLWTRRIWAPPPGTLATAFPHAEPVRPSHSSFTFTIITTTTTTTTATCLWKWAAGPQSNPRCKLRGNSAVSVTDVLTDQYCDLAKVFPLLHTFYLRWITEHQVAKHMHNLKNIRLSEQRFLRNCKKGKKLKRGEVACSRASEMRLTAPRPRQDTNSSRELGRNGAHMETSVH